jgi:hypothetical protein
MRESYKRFVKTWIRFANPWIRTVSWVRILTSKRFDSYLTIRIPDSYRIVVHESGHGKIRIVSYIRIQPIFKRFDLFSRILTNPHESSRILEHRRTLNKYESIRIPYFGFANPYSIQKIRIVDLFCRPGFIRFISWIRFVYPFSKDSYRGFDL